MNTCVLIAMAVMTAEGSAHQSSLAASRAPIKLVHEQTLEMPPGTHRPEVLVGDDGEVIVAVVQPVGPPGEGQVKHRAYRFDSDLNQVGEPMNLTWNEPPWGEPADHRAAWTGDELVVVYQTLNFPERGRPRRGGGPAEDHAIDQSLMLARFDLEGNELFRGPIVEQVTNFYIDNFPDHCLLLEGDSLLVSTGTRGGIIQQASPTVALREVNLEGEVLAEHRLPQDPDNIQGTIGNSMIRLDDQLVMVSGRPMAGAGLTLSLIEGTEHMSTKPMAKFPSTEERHFPTDILQVGECLLVGYIARSQSGGDPQKNPYAPHLLIIGPGMNEVADLAVGVEGFAHVHPTMALMGDRLLYCWSQRLPQGPGWMPQVMIEVFRIEPSAE
ncbi:MAG: hypothetical protein VX527_03625 [Planctomycetota bacterium]|nr:hypothetical protein [Planctomycetota bacterium]